MGGPWCAEKPWRAPVTRKAGAVLGGPRRPRQPDKKSVKKPFGRPPDFKFSLSGGIFESPDLILPQHGTTVAVGELGRPLSF